MKICRECGVEKPLSDYYKHKAMSDGHLNKCKSCVKKRVKGHRDDNIERIRHYDRNRPNRDERIKKQCEVIKEGRRRKDPVVLKRDKDRRDRYRGRYPDRYRANSAVNNALKNSRLERPSKCSSCGKDCVPEAHHWSYKKEHWLDVIWLCKNCHENEHKTYLSDLPF